MTLEQAQVILRKFLQPDGGLSGYSYNGGEDEGRYLSWSPEDAEACLDSDFTADELEAVAVIMRANRAQ